MLVRSESQEETQESILRVFRKLSSSFMRVLKLEKSQIFDFQDSDHRSPRTEVKGNFDHPPLETGNGDPSINTHLPSTASYFVCESVGVKTFS